MEFNSVIKKRASIRKYSDKKVSPTLITEIINTANLAPSPDNLPILTYVVIEDFETKNKLAEAARQEFIRDAPFLIVICSNKKKTQIMFDERAEKYIRQHAGAAIENMLLKITDLGLVSCWIGAFADDMVKDILKISDDDEMEIEAIIPVAYASKLYKPKEKFKPGLTNRLFFHEWKNKFYKKYTTIRREDL